MSGPWTAEEDRAFRAAADGADPLAETIAVFRRWLYLPDPTALYAVLGAVAANRLPGDPVWLLLVGPPGSGKSELLQSLGALPDVHPTATLTEAALLSGTPKRERDTGRAADCCGPSVRLESCSQRTSALSCRCNATRGQRCSRRSGRSTTATGPGT